MNVRWGNVNYVTTEHAVYCTIFLYIFAALEVSVDPQRVNVTEGGTVNITLHLNSSYEFDFTVTLQHMDGSATGKSFYWINLAKYIETLRTYCTEFMINQFSDWSSIHSHFSAYPLTAGADYEGGPYTVSFSGQQSAPLMVSTTDDSTTELSEYFKVVINSTSQPDLAQIGSPNMTFITIEDNDPGTYIHAHALHS